MVKPASEQLSCYHSIPARRRRRSMEAEQYQQGLIPGKVMDSNRRRFITQLVVLIAVVLGVFLVLNGMGVFKRRTPGVHHVSYRVEGSTAAAVVTYTRDDGSKTQPLDVSVPWRMDVYFNQPIPVFLTAGNPSQTGSITCKIILDSVEWKQESASAPNDKVSCAGILP